MSLFISFLKIGAFTFGGGYAMIPLIQAEFVLKQQVIEEEKMLEYIAIAQTAPGMIALNMATLVGRHINGLKGSLIAVLGVSLPSVIIMIIVSELLAILIGNAYFDWAIQGIMLAVIVLLFHALKDLSRIFHQHMDLIVYAILIFTGRLIFQVPVGLLIMSAFLLGALRTYFLTRKLKP